FTLGCSGWVSIQGSSDRRLTWKEKYLVLTVEGSLLVCRDAESPPDQVVSLQTCCESVAEGREILDLPRLPPGGRRDCCFALILPQNKFLLLLSDSPDDCRSSWPLCLKSLSLKH
uniref:PH domain-containing protein n=1 Tax=Oryzias sinensis TaxID=183150 RepID=A0A8C7Y9I8_9TELE